MNRPAALRSLIVAATLLLSGCGAGPTPAGRHSTASTAPSEFAFSACMRSHGVHDFPDPSSDGRPLQADPQQLGVGAGTYQAAEHACRQLLPTGGSLGLQTHYCLVFGRCPQSLVSRLLTLERQYAQCMRRHGVPNFPDPSISAKGGRPVFDVSSAGIDAQSTQTPQFIAEQRECRQLQGGSVPNLPFS